MKKKSLVFVTLAVALSMMTPVCALADTLTVSGLDIVNNTDKGSDYKLNQSQVNNISSNFNSGSQYNEVFAKDNGRYEENLSQEYSYLINHNIISRGNKIIANSSGVQVNQPSETAMPTGNENATDFLMGLYKSMYGTINSRELVFSYPSARNINGRTEILGNNSDILPNGYKGNDTNFDYKGDNYVYVSPNVPELYLSKLLSMGVINSDQIKDQNFLNAYNQNGATHDGVVSEQPWSNNANPYYPLEGNSTVQQALGSSWNCSVNSGTFTATRSTPDFMMQSNITTIQALEYIAKMMQVKDNTLSPEEMKIIDYDYGASYILTLPEPLKNTLSYLLAMGVISFQTPYDFSQLYSPLTKQYATQLLYRVANPAGRINFKKIQLTATDKTLMQDGFVKQNIQIDNVKDPVAEPKTISVTQTSGYYQSTGGGNPQPIGTNTTGLSSSQQSLFSKVASALGLVTKNKPTNYEANNSGTTQFTIVKEFLNPTQAMYMGTQVNQLSTGCSGVTATKWVNGKSALEVTFKIDAPNASTALAVINSRITLSNNANITSQIQTVTKITGNKTTVSYISQADLLSQLSDLEVVNDKTLRNKQTGAMAEFLTNDDMALIGNTVVHSPDPMVQLIDGQVYYNMAMVLPLLGNAYISNLDPGKMIVSGTLNKVNLTPVQESGNTIQYVPTTQLSNLAQGSVVSNGLMYDENQLTHGISTLMRNYMIQNPSGGTPFQATVIVDWAYSMPSGDIGNLQNVDSNPFNPISASNFLYTAPSNQLLLSWWNSNIGISNALANLLYGTTGGQYIRTGYLAPSVTILCNSKNPEMQNVILNSIFGKMQFSNYYINNYLGGHADDWKNQLFNQYGNGAGSRRQFNYVGSDETSSLGTMYNNQYFVTTTGKVFKKISEDPRLVYQNGNIIVNGRTQPSNAIPNVGSIVYMNKEYFYVKDLQNIGGSQYMALAALNPVSSLVVGQITGVNTGNMYNELYKAIDGYTKGLKGGYIQPSDYGKYNLPNSYLVPAQYIKNPSATYFANGSIKHVTTNNKSTTIQGDYNGSSFGGELYGNPVVYLSTEDYSILNGCVTNNKVSPYLEMGNIFYSGLNNSIITSVIGNSEGATSAKNLPNGAKVIIADTIYQKTPEGLTSYPIQNGSLVSSIISDPTNETNVQSSVEYLYTSTALFMSGRPVPFAKYIKSATIGSLPKGINQNLVNATLFSEGNNNLKYGNGTNISTWNGSTPKSVCINLQLQDGVNFVCLDKGSQTYQLETMSNIMGSNGQVGGNIFKNQLFFLNGNNLFTQYVKALYAPLPNWQKIMKDYTTSYDNQWWVNLGNSIKLLSVYIFILYFFLVLFSYIIVAYGIGKPFFEAIHLKIGKDGGTGPDIPSMITLGMCNLDGDIPSPNRIFIFMLLLFLAQYLIVTYL